MVAKTQRSQRITSCARRPERKSSSIRPLCLGLQAYLPSLLSEALQQQAYTDANATDLFVTAVRQLPEDRQIHHHN